MDSERSPRPFSPLSPGEARGRGYGRILRPRLIPTLGIGAVLLTALLLVFQVTLRPWANADSSWDTHLNLRTPPDGYTRTTLSYVSAGVGAPVGWEPLPAPASAPVSQGQLDYVGYGCASCHGVYGTGTAAAPPVAGSSVRRSTTLTRQGPGGMPAYDEAHLRGASLETIAEYVLSLPEQDRPAPLVAPSPTPDPVRLQAAQLLFVDVGCDLCHAEDAMGTEEGPALNDLTAQEVQDFVRDPVRPPDSTYPKEMKAYGLDKLLDEELEELIFYLSNLPG